MAETHYEVTIYWSAEDQAFVAEVSELAGCAADGRTREEALRNVDVAVREWIETARELGRPVPAARSIGHGLTPKHGLTRRRERRRDALPRSAQLRGGLAADAGATGSPALLTIWLLECA
jgi:predicted RNase H-like HicB family nuclease